LRRLGERYPAGRAANMTIMFNAQLCAPLHARITTKAQVIVGGQDARLSGLFKDSGMQVKRADGEAAAWGKLLINLANAVCALTHTTMQDLLTGPDLRAIYAAVLDEAVGVIERAGISYRLPMPLPYRLYRQLLLRGGPLPWCFARVRNGLQEGAYPSMVADVEGGRRTEVGQLNGEIVDLGRAQGMPTPINERIVFLMRELEGKLPPPYLEPSELRARLCV
jgi:2-dehydropantoate 2-reductase